jgi:hypothetical protein
MCDGIQTAELKLTMRITVTIEDIEAGRRYDPVRCPVARALRRSGMAYFTVMESAVRLRDEEHYGGLLVLPGTVQDWIRGFDRGEPVEPISFELELPWEQPAETAADFAEGVAEQAEPVAAEDSDLLPSFEFDAPETEELALAEK